MNHTLSFLNSNKDELSFSLKKSIFNLNQLNIPALGSLEDLNHLENLFKSSSFIALIKINNNLVGFAIIMGSLSEYSSPNFLYFKKKYNDFMYIDRIAISEKYHRKGFGSLIYKELYNQSKNLGIPLCCEVNTNPINQQSLDFHKKLEFSIIEEISFGKKTVAMMVKN